MQISVISEIYSKNIASFYDFSQFFLLKLSFPSIKAFTQYYSMANKIMELTAKTTVIPVGEKFF